MAPRLENLVTFAGGVAFVWLNDAKFTLTDISDLPLVIDGGGKWCLSGSGYAMRYCGGLPLHRHLLGLSPVGKGSRVVVDHIDQDRLNNQRGNLRVVSQSINNANKSRAQSNSRTGVLGVYPYGSRWTAQFRHKHLGVFDDIDQARRAVEAKRRSYLAAPKGN